MPLHSKQYQLLFSLLLLLLPATEALSREFSFDYAQATFTSSTINLGATPQELQGNGIGFDISLSFNANNAVKIFVLSSSFNIFQQMPVATIKTTGLGITSHTNISDSTELFGNLSAIIVKITSATAVTSDASDSDLGYDLNFGLRHFLSKSLELEVSLSHMYTFEYPANDVHVELRYYTDKLISVGLAYETGDNKDNLSINGRMSF